MLRRSYLRESMLIRMYSIRKNAFAHLRRFAYRAFRLLMPCGMYVRQMYSRGQQFSTFPGNHWPFRL